MDLIAAYCFVHPGEFICRGMFISKVSQLRKRAQVKKNNILLLRVMFFYNGEVRIFRFTSVGAIFSAISKNA